MSTAYDFAARLDERRCRHTRLLQQRGAVAVRTPSPHNPLGLWTLVTACHPADNRSRETRVLNSRIMTEMLEHELLEPVRTDYGVQAFRLRAAVTLDLFALAA